LGKLFGLDCAQIMGRKPRRLSDLFQSDAYPFPYGSQTEARAGELRSQAYSSGGHKYASK
jgi:hypothetical protein